MPHFESADPFLRRVILPLLVLMAAVASLTAPARADSTQLPLTIEPQQLGSTLRGLASTRPGQRRLVVAQVQPDPQAQPQPAQKAPEGIEEIVVTAQKREERLQDVPIAVTAVSGVDLEQKHLAVDLEALQGTIPNVQINHFTNTPHGAVFNIRGMGVIEPDPYAGNTVSVVVDGVPQVFNMTALLDLYDIERIEVLRGPQGTLFGANTTGGVINVITAQPTGEFGGKARITAGKWDRLDVAASLDFPILDGVLAGKLTAMHHSRDGWVTDRVTGSDMGSRETTAFRGYLKWTPVDTFDATLIGEWVRSRHGAPIVVDGAIPGEVHYFPPGSSPGPGQGFMYESPCKPNKRCRAPSQYYSANGPRLPDESDSDTYAATLTMNWTTSIGTITSISGYKYFEREEWTDQDGTPFFNDDTFRPTDGTQWSQELRGAFAPLEGIELIAGTFAQYSEYDHLQNFRIQFAAPGLQQLTYQDQENWSASVFAHAFWDITDQLRAQAGARFTHEDTEMEVAIDTRIDPTGQGSFCIPCNTRIDYFQVKEDETWDEYAYKVGLDYKPHDDILLYAFFSRGFKSGGFVGRIAFPSDIGPYDPEYVETVEAGIKSDWWDRRLRVNLAGFYNWYEDLQLAVIYFTQDRLGNTVNGNSILNAADAHTTGFELEVTALPYEGLTLFGSVGFLEAEYDDFPFLDPTTLVEIELDGEDLQNAPEWTTSVGFNYTLPIFGGNASVRTTYKYVDKKYNTSLLNTPRSEVQPTHIVDANLVWAPTDGDWSINFWALNLFDQRYIESVFDAPGIFGLVAYAPPRQYGVTFDYRW